MHYERASKESIKEHVDRVGVEILQIDCKDAADSMESERFWI
jgi:hypothetical protein